MIRRPPRSTRTATSFPTRRSSDLLVMLDHDDAVARVDEAVEEPEEVVDVGEMQARRGFVEHIDRPRLRHRDRELEPLPLPARRSEEHTSELQSLMRISYAVFCLKKKIKRRQT